MKSYKNFFLDLNIFNEGEEDFGTVMLAPCIMPHHVVLKIMRIYWVGFFFHNIIFPKKTNEQNYKNKRNTQKALINISMDQIRGEF